VAASRWTELFRRLEPPARLAALGALAVPASMLLPWYGIRGTGGLAKSGLDSFGLGQLALLFTVAAVLYLIVRCARGYLPPRPLSEAGLLVAGGIWAMLLVGYLMLDRPDSIAGFTSIKLRYGIFIALAGAAGIALGGLRLRAVRRSRGRARPPRPRP